MVHTFELLKMISKEMFEEIINTLNWTYYKTGFFFSTRYAKQGFSVISLHRFTKNRENDNKEQQQNTNPDNMFYMYMIKITVNLGAMFGDSGYRSNSILTFKRSFIDVIYYNIYDLLPCLEERKEYRQTDINNYSEYEYRLWKEANTFTLNRIDFTFDLKQYAKQYMTLINRGYTIRDKRFERSYYNDDDVSENVTVIIDEDGYPDIEYIEELTDEYSADTDYIYYKAKSLNINIYNKAEQLKRKYQSVDNVDDYDFLRFEVQVKKEKLKTLVKKFRLKGRALEYIATPQIEDYVLNEYLKKLTGTGSYMTQEQAFQIIDGSSYTKAKKERLKAIITAVSDNQGIAKMLEQVENGTITNLGKLSTVESYLNNIQELGVNPITLSDDMNIEEITATAVDNSHEIQITLLVNLIDVLKASYEQTLHDEQYGETLTEEDLKIIDEL